MLESNDFLNPVSAALGLIAEYRAAISQGLQRDGLDKAQADLLLRRLPVSAQPANEQSEELFDRGVWFTLRRPLAYSKETFDDLARELGLHDSVREAFRPKLATPYVHQAEAFRSILCEGRPTVIATGTGSGKTEAFLLPVLELCLRQPGPGVKAIIVYPLNALVEDQLQRINEYVQRTGLRAASYVGEQTNSQRRKRDRLLTDPPDIVLTNQVMLERIVTRAKLAPLRGHGTLRALVFDEIHTFRGNIGADVAWLIRRLRAAAGTQPICIGASATLQSQGDGVADASCSEANDHNDRIDAFLQQLFSPSDGTTVQLLSPTYAPEPRDGGELPEPCWERLGWRADLKQDGQSAVAALFGDSARAPSRLSDLLSDGPAANLDAWHDRLRGHAVVRAWRRALIEHGALSYGELVSEAGTTYERISGRPCPDAERLAQGCLTAIQRTNFEAAQAQDGNGTRAPLLNLVTHLVLRSVQGKASLCLYCSRYHLGADEVCPRCGRPLLDVWREDVRWALAIVPQGERRLLRLPPDNNPGTGNLMRIARAEALDAIPPDAHRVELVTDDSGDGPRFRAFGDGAWAMASVAAPRALDRAALTVCALDTQHGHDHLALLARAMLRIEGDRSRLLVFSNARQGTAVAGYALAESAATSYLLELLAERTGGRPIPLLEALQELKDMAQGWQDDYRKELADTLDLWFVRFCATSARLHPEHRGVLRARPNRAVSDLGEPAALLIDTCLCEGAVARTSDVASLPRSRVFEFDHLARTMRRVVTFDRNVKVRAGVQSVALTGEPNSRYEAPVRRWGPEALRRCADQLVERGVLCRVCAAFDGDETAYALQADAIELVPPPAGSLLPIYRAVGIHSAETPPEERRHLEADFQAEGGSLQTVAATATLELGVNFDRLRHVLCVGVPPSPANYAQRIGRAGRGKRSWYALGAIWCDDHSAHDMSYFRDAEETRFMLSGHVVPPSMDADNPLVVRRHLFAAAVEDRVDDPTELSRLAASPERCLDWLSEPLVREFASRLDVRKRLQDELGPGLCALLGACGDGPGANRWSSQTWFDSALAPDYGFRRDQVSLTTLESGGPDRDRWHPWQPPEEVISQRPLDEAVRHWAPSGVVATPRGLMRIERGLAKPGNRFAFPLNDDEALEADQYHTFLVSREEGLVRRGDRLGGYKVLARVDPHGELPSAEDPSWLAWRALPEATLAMVNVGRISRGRDAGEPATARAENAPPARAWGFSTNCAAFLVSYDPLILGTKGEATLACLLDHGVQRYFRLSESDLLLLDNPACPLIGSDQAGFVMADAAGRGLVSMQRLAAEFRAVLAQALRRIEACGCARGCFRCLRTYATARFAPLASRQDARRLLCAILGSGLWTPPLPANRVADEDTNVPVLVTLEYRRDRVHWSAAGTSGTVLDREGERAALRTAMHAVLDVVPSGSQLLVQTNKAYFGQLLDGTLKRVPDVEERRLRSRLLAFPPVRIAGAGGG